MEVSCFQEVQDIILSFFCQNISANVCDDPLQHLMVDNWVEIQIVLKEFLHFYMSFLKSIQKKELYVNFAHLSQIEVV
jgi:hypothetical protein